jgi:Kef-type K+ transport system membrane component KefB/nucleotide-binding universal stress UspA family protein
MTNRRQWWHVSVKGDVLKAGAIALGLVLFPITHVLAASGEGKGPSETLLILQVGLLVLGGRLIGELMQRIGQPTVIGQLLAGIILGPSVLGLLWPEVQQYIFPPKPEQKAMIDGIADIGVLMLLLLAGMETDLKLVRRIGRAAFSVSIAGILLPFAAGFLLGQFMPEHLLPNAGQRLMASLLLGTALSISSVKIVAMVVREMNFLRRNVGQIILASAVIDDTIGWIIIAVIFSLASHGSLDAKSLAQSIIGTVAFLAVSLTIGRPIVFHLIRWTNDTFKSELPVISLILVLMAAMALITQAIGVHTVLGAFVAGILVGESPIMTRHIDQQLRGLITALFAPIFFGLAGLTADLTVLRQPDLLMLTGVIILIATIGKFAGAFVGGTLGGLRKAESLALACGMNARGSTEVIVATIGLSMGLLNQNLFTVIVAMAVITTMAMPPMLRWALSRLPLGEDEKARLEREETDAKGFLPQVERLLLAVDDSPAGRFTSRLTGVVAGARGIPTTVLHLDGDTPARELLRPRGKAGEPAKTAKNDTRKDDASKDDTPEKHIKAEAEKTAALAEKSEAVRPDSVVVKSTRARQGDADRAVATEADKGYDLLLIGLDDMVDAEGGFNEAVSRVAAGFDGPLAVVVTRGDHRERPTTSGFKILLPVSGGPISMRAAEFAIAIARANNASLTALYVKQSSEAGGEQRTAKSRAAKGGMAKGGAAKAAAPSAGRRRPRGLDVDFGPSQEEAFLKDLVALAERHNTDMSTAIRADLAPDEAIQREAKRGGYNLIVMGVNRRPGEALYFGAVPSKVLQKSKASLLFLAAASAAASGRAEERH